VEDIEMSVSFWFPDYRSPRFEANLNTSNANWVLGLAEIDHDPNAPVGELSPEDLRGLVYNLEQFIIGYPDNMWHYANVRYLVIFSRLLGFAESSGLPLRFG
jgi:hypothetical protein